MTEFPSYSKDRGNARYTGAGEQGHENVRDCAVEAANRKGISSQGRRRLRPGEPEALKGARPVREGAVENVP